MKISKYETNIKRNVFFKEYLNFPFKEDIKNEENKLINVYPDITFQNIIGFGGALTGSSCYNLSTCSKEISNQILDDYFLSDGSNYNICRLSIASSDFNLNSYSYSNQKDLSDFSIKKDLEYVIPILKEAKKRNASLKIVSSCWSPPAFMKNTNKLTGGGKLLSEFKSIYARYLVKYILEYKKENINIDYLTIQNEPNAKQLWESCIYSASEELDFIHNFLYPEFNKNGINTKILIWDHNKESLVSRYQNQDFSDIPGFAFHWYTGDHFENIEILRKKYPELLLFHTEGCCGYSLLKRKSQIINAEIYAHDIIGDLNAGINAFIDWNIVLDFKGGPNHKFNFCDSPVMLNSLKNKYKKNLSFYYIKHFSKFIKPNSKRIAFSKYTDKIELTAFKNPDNSIIVVLLNRNDYNINYNLKINNNILHDTINKHGIITYEIKEI